MQPAYHIRTVRFLDHKGHIDGRGALGDDLDVGRPDRIEYPASKSGRIAQANADYGHDGAVLLDPHLAELAEIPDEWIEPGAILDGQRNAHLTASQHVDHGFVALKDLK